MAIDILIVDDEADIRTALCGLLDDEGYKSRAVANADAALTEIATRPPSLVILDIWLEGSRLDGLEILAEIKKTHPALPVLMISGHGTIETAIKAMKQGAYDFIEKPFKADRLLLVVQRALENSKLMRENQDLKSRSTAAEDELLGQSLAINQVRNLVEKTAQTSSRVLISGPQGSGKEIVARQLHRLSRRADAPFIIVSCANLHPDRFEHELFGTEHNGDRTIGLMEQAHNGTLVLDEVADMPLETQGKIVRVLSEQTFTRLGGQRPVQVDVRVVATSNRDLEQLVESGLMRQDLYYRLNVVPLRMPSLVERRQDIPELFAYFMRRLSDAAGLAPRQLADDAMAALQSYAWPGNVRQLRNMIEWVLIMAPVGDDAARSDIHVDQLPPEISGMTSEVLKWEKGASIMSLPLREARELFEREYLTSQLNRFGGNISRTAVFIGMERSALHRKLKLLGVAGADKDGADDTTTEAA